MKLEKLLQRELEARISKGEVLCDDCKMEKAILIFGDKCLCQNCYNKVIDSNHKLCFMLFFTFTIIAISKYISDYTNINYFVCLAICAIIAIAIRTILLKHKKTTPPTSETIDIDSESIDDYSVNDKVTIDAECERLKMFTRNFPEIFYRYVDTNNDIFIKSDKIFVSFRFDHETCKSWIVLTGRTYDESGTQLSSDELLIQTPHIPLFGGCWSNYMAMCMLTGQNLVSYMLDCTYQWLKYAMKYNLYCNNFYHVNDRKKDIEIIKVDRCFYGPRLSLKDENDNEEYMSFLSEKYPESYEQVLKYPTWDEYWENYHDKDVETNFGVHQK